MRYLELLFVMALVLYTFAIVKVFVNGDIRKKSILIFGLGLLADTCGTFFICYWATGGWQWTLHSIAGLAALAIMALHFSWAVAAYLGRSHWEYYFHKWSALAWALWVAAFVTGIPVSVWWQLAIAVAIAVFALFLGLGYFLYCVAQIDDEMHCTFE